MSPRRSPGRSHWMLEAAGGLARRPDLWRIALVEARAMSVRRWWRSWPPLPRLAKDWLEFRMETAYGEAAARPDAHDVVTWLEWCKEMRRRPR